MKYFLLKERNTKVKMNNISEIKIGSIISFLTVFINIILGLVYTPWTLKVIGTSEYGIYTLTSSLISIFLLDFGMSAAVARFISNYRAQNKQENIDSFVGLSTKFYLILCGLIAIILSAISIFIDKVYVGLTIEELFKFKIVFVINAVFIVLSFPVNICNGILTAYEKFVWLKGSDIINKVGTVIITVTVLLFGGGLYSLVFINGLLNFLTFIAKVIIIKKVTSVKISFKKDKDISFKEIFSFSVWSTVNSLSQQMNINLMPSILGMTTNTLSITVYGFARTIEGYVYNITQAINGLFMPTVSRIIVGKDDARDTLPLMIKVGRLNQSVISLLIMGLILLGEEFVGLWIGDGYEILYPCILLMTLNYLISSSQQIAGTSITVMNKLKYTSLINVISSIIVFVLSYFCSIEYEVIGVCTVILLGNIVKIVSANIVYKNVLHIDLSCFFWNCHLKLLPGIISSFFASGIVLHYFSVFGSGLIGWFLFGVRVFIVCIVYFILMWLLAWNEYEKGLILSIFRFGKRKR